MGLFNTFKSAILARVGHHETPMPTPPFAAASPVPEAYTDVRLTPDELASRLDTLSAVNAEDLQWRDSIVDLMKLVGMDSSYRHRREMAIELGYSEEDVHSKGSAEMNRWLHEEVMAKLCECLHGHLIMA